jgi:LAO/AO transport system kinase
MGKQITSQGRKLAVLAIDPSSERSRGSILGDKTEWKDYLRPSSLYPAFPSAGSLGGVAGRHVKPFHFVKLQDFEMIFIETVGSGTE